ncbi:ankyrin repeat domain-containing protein [Legionella massiliensis]|nr:ankyrin repeat domain-containing protein [Legionella massiliensis]
MTISKIENNGINLRKIRRGLEFLNQFPKKRFFQLFVDGDMHIIENGQNGFEEREPDCVRRFYDGFIQAINTINQPLSLELLLAIHEAATHGLKGEFKATVTGKFRDVRMKAMPFHKDMCTIEGIKEQIRIAESYDQRGNILGAAIKVYVPEISREIDLLSPRYFSIMNKAKAIYENSDQYPPSFIPPANTDLFANEAQKIIDDYLTQIQVAENMDAELLVIVGCAKKMLLLHPFEDGNLRVFVNIMLNFLLIQQGYPVCVFYNPNVFYLFSTEELVDVVKIGMMDSLFVSKNPSKPLFGYQVAETCLPDINKMKQAIVNLSNQYLIFQEELENDVQELEQRLQNSVNPTIKAFHLAATQGLIEPLAETDILQTKGPENTTTLFQGKTLLHVACLTKHYRLLKHLLTICPRLINEKDLLGDRVLNYAIVYGQFDLVAYLCSNPYLDLESEPMSYLNFALMLNKVDVVKILLEHGARVTEDSYRAIPQDSIYKAEFYDLLAGCYHKTL